MTYCGPLHRLLHSIPQKAFLLLLLSWQQPHCFCAALYIQTDTDLWAPGFFKKYVLRMWSLILLNMVTTFVSCMFLWLEKTLAKASLKCISGCTEQDVLLALLAWCAGAQREKKETIISRCQNNRFSLFFSNSTRAKSPACWSQGKDSHCFAQLWIKATV